MRLCQVMHGIVKVSLTKELQAAITGQLHSSNTHNTRVKIEPVIPSIMFYKTSQLYLWNLGHIYFEFMSRFHPFIISTLPCFGLILIVHYTRKGWKTLCDYI